MFVRSTPGAPACMSCRPAQILSSEKAKSMRMCLLGANQGPFRSTVTVETFSGSSLGGEGLRQLPPRLPFLLYHPGSEVLRASLPCTLPAQPWISSVDDVASSFESSAITSATEPEEAVAQRG